MTLLDLARADFARISQDDSGAMAESMVLTSPTGASATLNGIFTEVGATLDPSTGLTISATSASVVFAEAALVAAGLGIPSSQQERGAKPWMVTVTRIDGTAALYKLTEPRRDMRLGSHWFVLVPLQTE